MSAHCLNDELPDWQDVEDEQVLAKFVTDSVREFADIIANIIIRTLDEGLDGLQRDALLQEARMAEAQRRYRRENAIRRYTKRALLRPKTDTQADFDKHRADDEWTDQ